MAFNFPFSNKLILITRHVKLRILTDRIDTCISVQSFIRLATYNGILRSNKRS